MHKLHRLICETNGNGESGNGLLTNKAGKPLISGAIYRKQFVLNGFGSCTKGSINYIQCKFSKSY